MLKSLLHQKLLAFLLKLRVWAILENTKTCNNF